MMLEQILSEIHNWFQRDIFPGTYTIQDGGIELPFLRDGQPCRPRVSRQADASLRAETFLSRTPPSGKPSRKKYL